MSQRELYRDLIAGRAPSEARTAAAPRGPSRRTFLSASASAGGGLVLALTVGCKGKAASKGAPPPPPALEPGVPVVSAPVTTGSDLNAWIHIEPDDRVILRIAESEMGQGVLTALSMILAEELDADWSKVSAEHAPCDGARYGRQGTGGSSSVRQGWEPMKKAGASARAMLLAAGAERLGVPVGELVTEPGLVVHTASGRKLSYGALAADAVKQTPPEKLSYKDPARYRLVGTSVARLDAPAKVTGTAVYGLDVRLPGMKFAVMARPPTLGGQVSSFDGARALVVPGVEKVVQVAGGVAVIASNTWAAIEGRKALSVQWKAGPDAALDSAGLSAALASALAPGAPAPVVAKQEGKPEAALAAAKRKVSATYEAPYLAHATMEPLNCTVHVDGDRCEVWTGTQGPTRAQATVCEVLNIPPENVEIHTVFLGGGFGRRSQNDFIREAVQVAREVAAPVQLMWTRDDDLRAGFYRPAALAQIEAGLDAQGLPTAWVHRISSPSILDKLNGLVKGVDQSSVEGVVNLPYTVPNQLVTWANPKLPLSTWFWRSVGSSQNAWMVECFVDELARAAGKDPLAYRRKLLAKAPRHLAVLDKAATMAGWGKPRAPGRALGLAVHESFGSFVALVAEVSLPSGAGAGAEPRVHELWCAVDAGRIVNPNTVAAQMESGLIYGLSAALYGKVEVAGGAITTASFAQMPVVRLPGAPAIAVEILTSKEDPGGIGEPSTPVIAPAVCNALLALTGKPVRKLPIVPVA